MAHRVVYEEFVGPIPVGRLIHHACRNKACVNPDHLAVVTPRGHGHEHRGEACRYGHLLDEANVYWRPSDGYRMCRECRREIDRRRAERRKAARASAGHSRRDATLRRRRSASGQFLSD